MSKVAINENITIDPCIQISGETMTSDSIKYTDIVKNEIKMELKQLNYKLKMPGSDSIMNKGLIMDFISKYSEDSKFMLQ